MQPSPASIRYFLLGSLTLLLVACGRDSAQPESNALLSELACVSTLDNQWSCSVHQDPYGEMGYDLVFPPDQESIPQRAVLALHGIRENRNSVKSYFADEVIQNNYLGVFPSGAFVDNLIGQSWGVDPHREYISFSSPRNDLRLLEALITNLRQKLGIQEFHLVGHSIGGAMVYEFACNSNEEIRSYSVLKGFDLVENCNAEPSNLLIMHGMNDPYVPVEGWELDNLGDLSGHIPPLGKSYAAMAGNQRLPEPANHSKRTARGHIFL